MKTKQNKTEEKTTIEPEDCECESQSINEQECEIYKPNKTINQKPHQSLLELAQSIYADRQSQYGDPEPIHTMCAKFWTAYTGHKLKPTDVCIMMILLKIAREAHSENRDNLVDIAGYANVVDILKGGEV